MRSLKAATEAWVIAALLVALLLAPPAWADTLISATCQLPARVAVAAPDSPAALRIFTKDARGHWAPADFARQDGMIVLKLDPEKAGASRIYFLVNPRPDIDLDDAKPPLLLGVKVDGKPLALATDQYIGEFPKPPQSITFGVADRENPLDLHALRAKADNRPVDASHMPFSVISLRQVRLHVITADLSYGKHKVEVVVSDEAPLPNTLTAAVRFDVFDPTNYALAAQGTSLATDSCLPGYESLESLNDGVAYPPGPGRLNDVSWASADSPAAHWLELRFGQTRTISEIVVFWTLYRGKQHLPRETEVRIPQGEEWVKLDAKRIDGSGDNCITTFKFEPRPLQRVRVYQTAGSENAPGYMWVTEVEAR